MKILVVDDDSVGRRVWRAALMSRGHEVIESDSAFGTGSLILRESPDVVLLDIEMPGLRGDQAVGAILEHCDQNKRPIVLLHSGRDLDELQLLASMASADGVICKSPGAVNFLDTFDRAVGAATA